MKISNCLKLVLLCGCPPDNSNFQLQLGRPGSACHESQLTNEPSEVLTRSASFESRSHDSSDRIIKKCYFNNDSSDTSLTDVPEISNQEEQKAIALILEYLKMEYSQKPMFKKNEQTSVKSSKLGPVASKWRGKFFKKSHSMILKTEGHYNNDERRLRGKSLESNVANIRTRPTQNKMNPLKTFSYKIEKRPDDVEIAKTCVRSPKFKVPLNFFKKLTNQTILQSKTVVETSEMEIKEVIVTGKKLYNQKSKVKTSATISSNEGKFMYSKKGFNHKEDKGKQQYEDSHKLSPDTCIVLNPNVIDEVAPYVLRFVKNYLGDFRRYLLDTFIGVDSISLEYFESMVDLLDKFPIDDLTLFKNLKYTLATLFPQEEEKDFNTNNIRTERKSNKYEEKLQRKHIIEPMSYKYTITSKNPISFDKSMDEMPSFIVRYYPTGNKLHRNTSVQTEEIVGGNIGQRHLNYNIKNKKFLYNTLR